MTTEENPGGCDFLSHLCAGMAASPSPLGYSGGDTVGTAFPSEGMWGLAVNSRFFQHVLVSINLRLILKLFLSDL